MAISLYGRKAMLNLRCLTCFLANSSYFFYLLFGSVCYFALFVTNLSTLYESKLTCHKLHVINNIFGWLANIIHYT